MVERFNGRINSILATTCFRSRDDLHFANNYRDLCRQSGTGAGFQFEFYCECGNDTWRLPFAPYRSGHATGWMQQASSLIGGLLGNVGSSLDNAAECLAQAGWCTFARYRFQAGDPRRASTLPSLRALPQLCLRQLLEHRQRTVPQLCAGPGHRGTGHTALPAGSRFCPECGQAALS